MDLIETIRQAIDAEHREALYALEKLTHYLRGSSKMLVEAAPVSTARLGIKSGRARKTRRPSGRKRPGGRIGKYRNKVLPLIAGAWASVPEISEKTGLAKPQVRTVLYSKDVKVRLEKRQAGDKDTEYRLRPE